MKKLFLASLVLVSFTAQSTFASNLGVGEFFGDVNSSHSYGYQIDWLADNGVVRGYDDGTFKPEKCVNRAEFLKMMYAILETDVSAPYPAAMYMFGDVDLKAWYWPYLRYAIKSDIVQGYSDKTFQPGQCVNRAEAVKMAVLGFHNGKVPQPWGSLQTNLIDVAHDAWYSPMMEYAYDAHVLGVGHVDVKVTGVAGGAYGKYYPNDAMPRGEVAYLLYMLKALADNDVAANDSSIWANGKKQVSYNEERGVLMPKQLKNAYAFDDCGKMSKYASEAWYPDFLKTLDGPGAKDPILPRITDACFSKEAGRLIILVDEGYMKLSSIYKYTVNKSAGALEHADFPGNPAYGIVSIPQFGKRQGDFIPLTGEVGDAGGGTQCYFEYYFEKNLLALQRCRTFSSGETVGGTSTHPVYGSGQTIYTPWKIIK